MLGDEAQPAESDKRGGATSGPRHAAPRKSLLTKLHMPAGKAVALAAMPTAVLMGMGFTPHLAQADELPKSPFKPGPCVTQSDTPTPSASDAASGGAGKATDKPEPEPTTSPSPSVSPTAPAPNTSPSPAAPDKPAATSQPKSAPTSAPKADPSPTKSTNPLDPLGLGDLLGGLLGLDGKPSSPTPTATPTTQAPAPGPTATTKPPADPVKSTGPTGSTGSTGDGAGKDAAKDAKDPAEGATKGVKKDTEKLKDAATTPPAAPDGKQAYPCPTTDAQALADAKNEQGIPLLPDTPWVLKSSLLTLYGLTYDGIVQVKTYNGTVKDVLKFTATGVDIGDLNQIVDGPKNTKTHVTARSGSTSTIRNGKVTMYTESLSGNLLGVVPITFTPKFPPPITVPVLFFTDVTVIQAGQFGGDLHVPGMRVLPGQSS
ncbi:hydrogenase expression protein HypF [Streptomyces sp. IBSBF 2435]|uniref:hydrogenase expression protein HypF n=1 Tax=Streptomyces sp. IBSBF 2435 TaxID=2903531 RepID=UPI002FDBB96D